MSSVLLAVLLLAVGSRAQSVQDWLVANVTTPVELVQVLMGRVIHCNQQLYQQQVNDTTYMLTNGLISRTFTTYPDFGTINYYSYTAEQSLYRAIYPEAQMTIDGKF